MPLQTVLPVSDWMFAMLPRSFALSSDVSSNRCEMDFLVQSPSLGLLMKFHFKSVGNGGLSKLPPSTFAAFESPPFDGWPRYDPTWDVGVYWTPFRFGPLTNHLLPPLSANGLFPGGGTMVRFGGFSNFVRPWGGVVVYLGLGGSLGGWQQCYMNAGDAFTGDFRYWRFGSTNFNLVYMHQLPHSHLDERTRTHVTIP